MSANLFDAGDFQRLDRERTLTEQAPRQLPEEDRSPPEDVPIERPESESGEYDFILDGILEALKRRL